PGGPRWRTRTCKRDRRLRRRRTQNPPQLACSASFGGMLPALRAVGPHARWRVRPYPFHRSPVTARSTEHEFHASSWAKEKDQATQRLLFRALGGRGAGGLRPAEGRDLLGDLGKPE